MTDNKIALKESIHDLTTTENTIVYEEANFDFNAPHLFVVKNSKTGEELLKVHFQEGPTKENDLNGVFHEDLILMIIRRLESFQNSEYRCRENAVAITKLEETLMWLRKRNLNRKRRNVIGTSIV